MEPSVVLKARKLMIGQKIAIFPLNQMYGDMRASYAEICSQESMVELAEPFQAEFVSFDGRYLKCRCERYGCISIDIMSLENLETV